MYVIKPKNIQGVPPWLHTRRKRRNYIHGQARDNIPSLSAWIKIIICTTAIQNQVACDLNVITRSVYVIKVADFGCNHDKVVYVIKPKDIQGVNALITYAPKTAQLHTRVNPWLHTKPFGLDKKISKQNALRFFWRRGQDSNLRYVSVHNISNVAPSTTQTPLRTVDFALSA